MDSPIQAGHGSRDFGGVWMFPDLAFENLSQKMNIWKWYKHPKQVLIVILAWRSRTLLRLPVWSCKSALSFSPRRCRWDPGGPELLSLYVPTSMHHMRYKQRKIRENLVFWDIHLKHAEMQIPAGQIQSHLVNCNLEEPWFILEASIIIGMNFLYAPLGGVV